MGSLLSPPCAQSPQRRRPVAGDPDSAHGWGTHFRADGCVGFSGPEGRRTSLLEFAGLKPRAPSEGLGWARCFPTSPKEGDIHRFSCGAMRGRMRTPGLKPDLFCGVCGTTEVHPSDEDLSPGTPTSHALTQSKMQPQIFRLCCASLKMTETGNRRTGTGKQLLAASS